MQDHKLIKIILLLLVIVFFFVGLWGIGTYKKAYVPNVKLIKKEKAIHIPTGSTYEDVLKIFEKEKVLVNIQTFDWAAKRKNYPRHVHPGRYVLKNRMSNNQLINMLRSGLQKPVYVTFNNIRFLEQLALSISKQIEADSASIMALFRNDSFLKEHGFNYYTVKAMFIPDSYEFWWNTDALGFFTRMKKEYEKFWSEERLNKASTIGLSPAEVSTMASIIEEETRKNDEKSRIAGVYINRLEKGIRLQADPTIKYAMGNFNVSRILKHQLEVESPFNTYKYAGLPPGPIRIPSIVSIDAVLDYEKHDYLYFCARADFSGYHEFAKSLEQHNRNARLYQRALSRRRIYR
ncbi:MAG: endolytic transglycosylase MltG [Bacteroidales bacterium]|nr:endolytic transglycosylase MltG [Bacteroidales bacterium]